MNTGIIELSQQMMELLTHTDDSQLDLYSSFSREIFLLDIVVAGTSFCAKIEELEPKLLPETVLTMRRCPDNEYDPQAIALYFGEDQVGWVPREWNLIISRLMDAGKGFFCRIVKIHNKNRWVKIDAKIYMAE